MRCYRFLALLSFIAAVPAWAQTRGEVPPVPDARPPALEIIDDSVQPQVTIRKKGDDVIEEYRRNGLLYKVVVVPAQGAPYTLIDPKGDGKLVPMDQAGSPQLSVPMWEIGTF